MKKPLQVSLKLGFFVFAFVGAWSAATWERQSDFLRLARPSEMELLHVNAVVTRISDRVPYVELRLPNGRLELATFVTFPTPSRRVPDYDLGAADQETLQRLRECNQAEFELFPHPNSLIGYWIYAASCDGNVLLTYEETRRYLQQQKHFVTW